MERIGIYDARSRLSELVDRVEAGEEVVLMRRGKPVVRMVRARDGERDRSRRAAVDRVRALRGAMKLNIAREVVRKAVAKGRA